MASKPRLTNDFTGRTEAAIRLADGSLVLMDANIIKMPEDLSILELALHRPHNRRPQRFNWVVSELKTGKKVGVGDTMKRAIENALFRIRQHKMEDVLAMIDLARITEEERHAAQRIEKVAAEKLAGAGDAPVEEAGGISRSKKTTK